MSESGNFISSGLPEDLQLATRGMDVSPELIARYCLGERAAHTLASTATFGAFEPSAPTSARRLGLDLLPSVDDLKAMWAA